MTERPYVDEQATESATLRVGADGGKPGWSRALAHVCAVSSFGLDARRTSGDGLLEIAFPPSFETKIGSSAGIR